MYLADEETEKLWFYVILLVAAMASLAIRSIFFGRHAVTKRFDKMPKSDPSKVKDDSYVKLVGKALRVGELLTAPISGRDCIFYHVTIVRVTERNSYPIIDDKRGTDFFLDVDGEQVIVRLAARYSEAVVHIHKDHFTKSGFGSDAPRRLKNVVEGYGKSSTTLFGKDKSLNYEEGTIVAEEEVAVIGVAKWKHLDEPIEGYPYSKILELTGTDKKKLRISDYREITKSRKM